MQAEHDGQRATMWAAGSRLKGGTGLAVGLLGRSIPEVRERLRFDK